MKHIILVAIILTLSACGVFAFRPKIDYQDTYLEVTDVERQDTCLRISVILKNYPGYWVNIPKDEVFLRTQNDTVSKYRLLGSEKFELNKRIWMKESGQHEGVLIFEKIPYDVSVVDMISTEDNGKTETMALGINLKEKYTNEPPEMIDPKTLFDTASSNKWTGLEPNRYRDIPFYKEQGKAHVKGKLHDYHPVAGYSTLKIQKNNVITGSRDVLTENLNPDGTFEFDLNVDYPQYCTLVIGDMPSNEVFVIPGDTVELVTTTQTDFLNPANGYRKYFGFTDKINDATAVNLLTDSLRRRYSIDKIISQYGPAKTDSLAKDVYSKADGLVSTLNEIAIDLPEFLGNVNISEYAKDLLATDVLVRISSVIQGNEAIFGQRHKPKVSIDSTYINIEPYESLDIERLYKPLAKISRLIFCNPLIISTNRSYYQNNNSLFWGLGAALEGGISPDLIKRIAEITNSDYRRTDMNEIKEKSGYELLCMINSDNEEKTGVGNCFTLQLQLVKSLIESIEVRTLHDLESLNKTKENVTDLATLIEYPALNKALLNAYTSLVEDIVLEENGIKKESDYTRLDIDKDKDVLEELIKPYLGNLIYIDFWALWCPPCRQGMIDQKKIIERFADQPFKVLYVADDSNIAGSNQWLEKKKIEGEHIYLSSENWRRISEYFNFNYIPFGVLIGKDGKLIKTHFNLDHPNADKEIERHLKE